MTRLLRQFTLGLLILSSPINASELLLYGAPQHDDFLGCLVCNEFSSTSVCNGFGPHGNEFGSNMWNEFSSPYGNEFSSASPWNEFSSSNSVPVLVDRQGNFYGYFTINYLRGDAVSFAHDLYELFRYYDGDLEKVRNALCDSLN